MKKIYDWIKKYPFILVLVIILLFFTPFAIFSPGESRKRAIVLAIGLDKIEDKYEISLLTFIPTPNQEFTESNSVISGIGSSISEAVFDAQLTLGKNIGLSHAKTTVVNEKMLEEDITSSLDYLSLIASLSENTVFICTNSSAKDLLLATSSLEENLGLKLDQLISYNSNEVYTMDTSLEAFYRGYYSPQKSSIIGYIEHVKEDEQNQTSSQDNSQSNSQSESQSGGASGEQSGGDENSSSQSAVKQSNSSSQSEQKSLTEKDKQRGSISGQSEILNIGEAVVLREGKKVAMLDIDNINSLKLLTNKKSFDTIKITDVKYEQDKAFDMAFTIKNKQVAIKTDFQNGVPMFIINLNLGVQLSEIDTKGEEFKEESQFTQITQEIDAKIQNVLKNEFVKALKILRDSKADVIGVYEKFYRSNRKDFLKFLNNLDDKDDYLNNIVFVMNFKIQSDG